MAWNGAYRSENGRIGDAAVCDLIADHIQTLLHERILGEGRVEKEECEEEGSHGYGKVQRRGVLSMPEM